MREAFSDENIADGGSDTSYGGVAQPDLERSGGVTGLKVGGGFGEITSSETLPDDVGAVTIVDGRVVSMYQDPAVAEFLRLHRQEVHKRAVIMKMGKAGLFNGEELPELE